MSHITRDHWEEIYDSKNPGQMSWTQQVPSASLEFIHSFPLNKNATIIDIGGGDSRLVDSLLDEGYEHITVLDISAKALERAQKRLGSKAGNVNWVVSDVTEFTPPGQYDIWHDRATFHFLTTPEQIATYLKIARQSVKGFMITGAFSTSGPTRCSGLEIKQYSEQTLTIQLENGFDKLKCINEDHVTPFNTVQHFLFCSFQRQQNG